MGTRQSRFQTWTNIFLPDVVDGTVQRRYRKARYRCRIRRYTNLDQLDRLEQNNSENTENIAQIEVGIDLAMYFDDFNQLSFYGIQRNRKLFPINETGDENCEDEV